MWIANATSQFRKWSKGKMIAFTLESIHICERRFLISQQCQRSIPWEQPRKELETQQGETVCNVLTSASSFLSWAGGWEQYSPPKNSLRVRAVKCTASLGFLGNLTLNWPSKWNHIYCNFWHLCGPFTIALLLSCQTGLAQWLCWHLAVNHHKTLLF